MPVPNKNSLIPNGNDWLLLLVDLHQSTSGVGFLNNFLNDCVMGNKPKACLSCGKAASFGDPHAAYELNR